MSDPRFAGVPIASPPIPDDDGSTSRQLQGALDALSTGRGTGTSVLEAMSASRLLVPVVAVLDSSDVDAEGRRHEQESSMATIFVSSSEHGRALLAFSGSVALQRWRQDARPVALAAPLAARAAVGESADALLVDVAGPTPFAVAGYELLLLGSVARGAGPVESDPLLGAAITTCLGEDIEAEFIIRGGDGQPAHVAFRADPDEAMRRILVERLARDRIIARLLPEGLRVSFGETS